MPGSPRTGASPAFRSTIGYWVGMWAQEVEPVEIRAGDAVHQLLHALMFQAAHFASSATVPFHCECQGRREATFTTQIVHSIGHPTRALISQAQLQERVRPLWQTPGHAIPSPASCEISGEHSCKAYRSGLARSCPGLSKQVCLLGRRRNLSRRVYICRPGAVRF